MTVKLKPNETITYDITLEKVVKEASEPSVTMVRLIELNQEYVLGYKILCSARLEGSGKYNIRVERKVTKRDLSLSEAIVELMKFNKDGTALISVQKPVVTKRKLTVQDIFKAIGR